MNGYGTDYPPRAPECGSRARSGTGRLFIWLAPLEALLADWPTGFRKHVEQRISAGRKDARTLNTLLGDCYIRLRKLCQGTTLEPLLQIIIDVAAEKSDCVLGLDPDKAVAEDATGYLRAPDAAKAIGVSVSRLHDSIIAGECEHRARRTGTRGQVLGRPFAIGACIAASHPTNRDGMHFAS